MAGLTLAGRSVWAASARQNDSIPQCWLMAAGAAEPQSLELVEDSDCLKAKLSIWDFATRQWKFIQRLTKLCSSNNWKSDLPKYHQSCADKSIRIKGRP